MTADVVAAAQGLLVGSAIGDALRWFGFRFVAVESDWRRDDDLRNQGAQVVYGDASSRVILEQLNLPRARVLVVALPGSDRDPTGRRARPRDRTECPGGSLDSDTR